MSKSSRPHRNRSFPGIFSGRLFSSASSRRVSPLPCTLYLHEQLHAHLGAQPGLRAALEEVRTWYPQVPDQSGGGARSEFSTRLHLILCTLELEGLAHFLGEARAREHLSRTRAYRWVYAEVLAHAERFRALISRHHLGVRAD